MYQFVYDKLIEVAGEKKKEKKMTFFSTLVLQKTFYFLPLAHQDFVRGI